MEAEETEDSIVGAWAKDDGGLEQGGNGEERLETHFEDRSDKTYERPKSLIRKRLGFGTLIMYHSVR